MNLGDVENGLKRFADSLFMPKPGDKVDCPLFFRPTAIAMFAVLALAALIVPTTIALTQKPQKFEDRSQEAEEKTAAGHSERSEEADKLIPPQAVNADLPDKTPIYFDKKPQDNADIGLLARIEEVRQYATEVNGDWENHWYFIRCSILQNTLGKYKDKELVFICYDAWPTPESGIKLKKVPFPYLTGRIFHFWLQVKSNLPLPQIVGQEQRSPIAPYEKLNRPKWNLDDPAQKEAFDKIDRAAMLFFVKNSEHIRGDSSHISQIHQTNDYYIVESTTWRNHVGEVQFVLIDKKTFQATSPPQTVVSIPNSQFAAAEKKIIEAIEKSLPDNYHITKREEKSSPFYLETGDGVALYIADKNARYIKQQYSDVVWLMPKHYAGRPSIEDQSPHQTWSPRLILETNHFKVYNWPGPTELSKKIVEVIEKTEKESLSGVLKLTDYQLQTIMPVFLQLAEDLSRITSKYPELAEYQKEKAVTVSQPSASKSNIGRIELSYQHNFSATRTKREIQTSDFDTNGFYVSFKCQLIPGGSVPDYAMPLPTKALRNLGLYLWTEVETGNNPSPCLIEEIQALLQLYSEKLQELDKYSDAGSSR